jgi:hypothetical protein
MSQHPTRPHSHNNASPHQSSSKIWSSLLRATLECWIYQILYQRDVYPRETFQTSGCSTPLSISCHHPQIRSYVEEHALPVMIPAIVQGVANEIHLCIFQVLPTDGSGGGTCGECGDDGGGSKNVNPDEQEPLHREMERYVLRFQMNAPPTEATSHTTIRRPEEEDNEEEDQKIHQWECGMRNLLLSIPTCAYSIPTSHCRHSHSHPNYTFQLKLHILDKLLPHPDNNTTGPEWLHDVLQNGTWWYIPSHTGNSTLDDDDATTTTTMMTTVTTGMAIRAASASTTTTTTGGDGASPPPLPLPIIRPVHYYVDAWMGSIQFAVVLPPPPSRLPNGSTTYQSHGTTHTGENV